MSVFGSPLSGPGTPASDAPALLSPSRKVQALLAQFSDSDSETEQSTTQQKSTLRREKVAESPGSVSDSDDHDEIQLQGRLAARLLGERKPENDSNRTLANVSTVTSIDQSQSPVQATIKMRGMASSVESSDDEVVTIGPMRRRLLTQRKSSPILHNEPNPTIRRSASSVLSPSPSPVSRGNNSTGSPSKATGNGQSKFLALVEKHRKERLEKEAAEVAKRAMGVEPERRTRGSSPADDSSEGSSSANGEAVKRLQKQARPTRKASKRAIEEMNRETQRMSRNMQLAHQAQTRKKVTKESLFARFNYPRSVVSPVDQAPNAGRTSASNSTVTSESENENYHQTTPPTSPLKDSEDHREKLDAPQVKDLTHLLEDGHILSEMHGASAEDEELTSLENIAYGQSTTAGMQKLLDFQMKDRTVLSPRAYKGASLIRNSRHQMAPAQAVSQSLRMMPVLGRSVIRTRDSDSDEEIEIIRERGQRRKYAAFETLPKRKARETPSHLALRSLAHLMNQDDKKRSINSAELDADLRRKARLQAIRERQQRIEQARAKGITIQSAEDRERDQQEVEDLVERARQEAVEIQKREKQIAKKDGTYVKDNLDDDDDDDSADADFEEELEDSQGSESEDEEQGVGNDGELEGLIDDEANEAESDDAAEMDEHTHNIPLEVELPTVNGLAPRQRSSRKLLIVSDDEDEREDCDIEVPRQSPQLPFLTKTPVSISRSARKQIPGLQMSDDLPMGLSQAFAATMAESQSQEMSQTQGQNSLDCLADLPTPHLSVPPLQRLESLDLVGESQPSASQTQPLNTNLISQSQVVPESPYRVGITAVEYTPSQKQIPFELTQDDGYMLSPFAGNRFAKTPTLAAPRSTVDTVVVAHGVEDSPIVQRRGRLQRRRGMTEDDDVDDVPKVTAFQLMQQATKRKDAQPDFDKKKSGARNIVDEAAEESEDEYAGLGGASDDSGDDEENEDDRRMIDEDTQIGKGDEAKLAGLFADRERERDEQEVSKLLKDITTGALRRKRAVGDDLDLSDEEDAAARRREAKRREFARMRRELLKDEAVGKIAEDKRKEAFLRSIEDREMVEDDEGEPVQHENPEVSQSQGLDVEVLVEDGQQKVDGGLQGPRPLDPASESRLNRAPATSRRTNSSFNRKPVTLAEIRETVSFLVEEPESQAAIVDLGLSDSEEEPEAYVNLDRHFKEAEADENALDEDEDDLGDFVVDDAPKGGADTLDGSFKKPELPRQERAPFSERRTKNTNVVDRLTLLRQASSSTSTASGGSAPTKMAFLSSKTGGSFSGIPSLLRRATTNSSLGSMSGRENVSATGVVTNRTERGSAAEEKEFVRKGSGGRRNAVNYQTERKTLREEKMSARAGVAKATKVKKRSDFLGGLFHSDSWE